MQVEHIIADRDPRHRFEWPVTRGRTGEVLGEIAVEVWIDDELAHEVIETHLLGDEERAIALFRERPGAVRVWADDVVVATWITETAMDYGSAASTPGARWIVGNAGPHDHREDAALLVYQRAGGSLANRDQPLFCVRGADGMFRIRFDSDPSPLSVMPRDTATGETLTVCEFSDLTVDEVTSQVSHEIHALSRSRWASVYGPTPDERRSTLEGLVELYSEHEGWRIEFVAARAAQKKSSRDRRRRGKAARRASLPRVPMYFLAGGGGRTKPLGLPQRVIAKALRMLQFGEEEIANAIGAARSALGSAVGRDLSVGSADDRGIAGAQLRRELGRGARMLGGLFTAGAARGGAPYTLDELRDGVEVARLMAVKR